MNQCGNNVTAKITTLSRPTDYIERAGQNGLPKNVHTHTNPRHVWTKCVSTRQHWLFLKADDPRSRVDLKYTEPSRILDRALHRSNRDVRVRLDMLAHHIAVVHLVNVIARKHE